jgi:uncharacterized membrane protein YkgB
VFGVAVATEPPLTCDNAQRQSDRINQNGENTMNQTQSGRTIDVEDGLEKATERIDHAAAKSMLTKVAAWISARNIPFLITSIGLAVMLLWAGSYKMTAPGAEGIIPLVSNSPLVSWHFKLFGPYAGSDLIGLTEFTAAVLILAGYLWPKAGVVGGLIACVMFFTTSTMVMTTPGAITMVHGMGYMSFLGLFLFKDVISLGGSSYLVSYFGEKAILSENRS